MSIDDEQASIFKEAIVLHQDQEYDKAIKLYEEFLGSLNQTEASSTETTELIEDFKQLAINTTSLLEYEYSDKDVEEKPEDHEDQENQEKATEKETEEEPEEDHSEEIAEDDEEETGPSTRKQDAGQEIATPDESTSIDDAKEEQILSKTSVNYRGYLVNSSDTIYSKSEEFSEYETLEISELQGREVKVLEEVETSQTTWARIEVVGANVSGWIDKESIDIEAVSSQEEVNYRGYLSRSNDTINTQPWGTPGYEEIRRVEDLQGKEVRVLEEAQTQRATWLHIKVNGTNISGWIDKAGIDIEAVSSQKDVNYRGYLSRSNDTINTQPWGTPGYEEIRRVEDLQGKEVRVLEEAQTQRATWLYIKVNGTNITGWIDKAGIDIETVSSEKDVNYRGYLSRTNDTINTQPWGTPGYEEIRRVKDLKGKEVKVLKETQTQRATWLYVEVVGADVAGWIDQKGIETEAISSQENVNYRGYLSRSNDTINTQPWGVPGYQEIRRVRDLQGKEVKVLKEAQTQRATWLYIDVVGTNVSGWVDQAGVDVETISTQNDVNYRGYLSRASDSINTQPWGTPGYSTIRQVGDLHGREVEVLKEAKTQRATWAFVNVLGTSISGWIDTAGIGSHLIYVDPGHGGSDTGATSGGVQEKDLNLTLSKKVRDILENKGYTVVMSREIDEFPSLSDRAQEANNIGADIFVSIHHNSFNGNAHGIETFYYNENGNTNNPLANDGERIENSKSLAESIQQELINETGANNRGVKRANFHVVRETKMPAVLVEGGFIDNTVERAKLILDSYQQKLANAISTGIDKILSNWP